MSYLDFPFGWVWPWAVVAGGWGLGIGQQVSRAWGPACTWASWDLACVISASGYIGMKEVEEGER